MVSHDQVHTDAVYGWVSDDLQYREIGSERWAVIWYTLKEGWEPEFEGDAPDLDRDLVYHQATRATRDLAVKAAKRIREDFFGCPTVQLQRVEWYVQEDGFAHWEDAGDPEEVR